MSEEHDHDHDHDLASELPTDAVEKLDEYDVQDPVETVTSIAGIDLERGLLALAGGGLVLLSALRSLGKGQLRAIPKAAVAAGLISYGLRNRASSEGPETFQPTFDEIEGGGDKEVSDAAHAAAERPDSGQESEIDADGDVHESAQLGDEGETGSRIEFSDDDELDEEPRTKPDHVGDEEDPRRNTDGTAATDDDDVVEVDVSDTAMAEETSEATGPDPEQAQPAQTDATEPEETPDEDASDMKVEPDEESDSVSDDVDEDEEE